jgi:uncharacterized protein YecT (DUF1311 family)
MNSEAHEQAQAAGQELNEVLRLLDLTDSNEDLKHTQQAWTEFRRLHAEYISDINEPFSGSMAPMLYSGEYKKMTLDRIAQLRSTMEGRGYE